MKKAFLGALVSLCLAGYIHAQDEGLDSIKSLVEEYQIRDSLRVGLLVDLTKYYSNTDINQNLVLINEALDISEEIGYARGKGLSLNALSKYYVVTGQLDLALQKALEAKSIHDSIGFKEGVISSNNNLGRIYNVSGEPDKSLDIHLENVTLVENRPPSSEKAGMYFYVGKTFETLQQLDSAEVYYVNALEISKAANFQTGIAIAEGALGSVYTGAGKFDKAIEYLKKTLEFAKKYGQETNIAAAHFGLVTCYEGLGKYMLALENNSRAIATFESTNNMRLLSNAYSNQSRLYEKLNNPEQALLFYKKYTAVKDSLFSESKVKTIEDLKTKYETEKKEAQILTLSQDATISELMIKQQRYGLVGLGGILIMLLGGGVLLVRQRKLKEEQLLTAVELKETRNRLKLEQQNRASELKAIRSQMNPHFVFNALNSIQEYIMSNERKLAGMYLGKFADLMRIYLGHSQVKLVTVQEEFEALDLYLELEKLRFEESLTYQITIGQEVDQGIEIPSLLLQPYVENAIKHGLLHKESDRRLLIDVNYDTEEDILSCTIKDNGIGRARSQEINQMRNPGHQSFATSATKSRLDLLNQDHQRPIVESVEDLVDEEGKPAGTKVTLIIPI